MKPTSRSLIPLVFLLAAGAAMASNSTTVKLTAGGSNSPQASVIGGDAITDTELDSALAGDDHDDDLVNANGGAGGVRAAMNRSVAVAPGLPREGRDSDRATANPQLLRSFDGVNFHDQRFSNNGNQFSVEPPDQGLCAGNGFVISSANDVMRIFDTTGTLVVGPVDLNTFYGYPAAINRSTNPLTFGPSLTDPVCYYDQQVRRFFHVVLTLDRFVPTSQGLSGKNHLDIAVSDSANPTGSWTVFKLPVQNDGTDGTPDHGCVARAGKILVHGPCLGDYPHIGADENALFLTTNEFSLAGPGFFGAQIYAISKRALATNAATVNAVLFNTGDPSSQVFGFTVWPAQSPGDDDFATAGHGTEYLLSSDAVFNDDNTSNDLVVWSVANTRSIDSAAPALTLNAAAVTVASYSVPPKATQKAGSLPLRDCIADTTPGASRCGNVIGSGPPRNNPESKLDANDSRMQQVAFAKGKLWGALDTSVTVGGAVQAGIAYFVLEPRSGRISSQGTIAVANNNVTYPAIAVNEDGRGVIAFTLVGADHFPSAGYAGLDARSGAGAIHVAAEGLGPQDGFAGYRPFSNRPRWGDYGAAASDGSSIWISSEYIGQTCSFAQYSAAPFGTCGGTRGSLGNWDTRISQVLPGDDD